MHCPKISKHVVLCTSKSAEVVQNDLITCQTLVSYVSYPCPNVPVRIKVPCYFARLSAHVHLSFAHMSVHVCKYGPNCKSGSESIQFCQNIYNICKDVNSLSSLLFVQPCQVCCWFRNHVSKMLSCHSVKQTFQV